MKYHKLFLIGPFTMFLSAYVFAQADLEEWKYVSEVTVDNSQSEDYLIDHQISIPLHVEQLIRQGKLQEDARDILLTDEEGVPLCHWLERNEDAPSKVWVRVPYVEAGAIRKILLFYGNVHAADTPNADCTFDLFDDFLADTLNTHRWEVVGNGDMEIGNSMAVLRADNKDMLLRTKESFSRPVIIEMKLQQSRGKIISLAFVQQENPLEGYTLWLDHLSGDMNMSYLDPIFPSPCGGFGYTKPGVSAEARDEGVWSLSPVTFNQIFGKIGEDEFTEQNVMMEEQAIRVAFGILACQTQASGEMQVDWIRLRKFAETEPQVTLGPQMMSEGMLNNLKIMKLKVPTA